MAAADLDLSAAIDLLDRRFGLDALWLFGSHAAGTARAESDIDLAVLFRTSPPALEVLDTRNELAETLAHPVDLIDLERASPVLSMQVLRTGKLLVDHNRDHRIRFTAALPGRYEDVLRMRRPGERILIERMTHGQS